MRMKSIGWCCLTAFCVAVSFLAHAEEEKGPSLVERLGFAPNARVLIINADDFGMNHATNEGTIKALKSGGITSATVMVPCGWFLGAAEFARRNPQANIGVHTTLTSEWGRYKWGPVLGCSVVPGLCDEMGYFHPEVTMIYAMSNPEEAAKEVRAQIDKALAAGIDVTHIDSHMGAMQYAAPFFEKYIRIADEYNLPCRLAGEDILGPLGMMYLLDLARELNVLGPERLFMGDPPTIEATESWWKARLAEVPEGKVSEIYIHAAIDTPEMRATTGSAARRTADTDFFRAPATLAWMREQGIELISYRELRHLQREGVPMPRVKHYGWE